MANGCPSFPPTLCDFSAVTCVPAGGESARVRTLLLGGFSLFPPFLSLTLVLSTSLSLSRYLPPTHAPLGAAKPSLFSGIHERVCSRVTGKGREGREGKKGVGGWDGACVRVCVW